MASTPHVHLSYTPDFDGTVRTDRNYSTSIGRNGLYPYELLLSALGSCLYATLLDILEKRKVKIESAEFDIQSRKREEIPTTLEWCNVTCSVTGSFNTKSQEKIRKSMDLAAKYCSIYQTLSKVAKMEWTLEFRQNPVT